MRKIIAAILLTFPTVTVAEQYLCVADVSAALSYQSASKNWQATTPNNIDIKYVVYGTSDPEYEVKLLEGQGQRMSD